MELDLDRIEARFDLYLDKFKESIDMTQFQFVFIQLLFLFEDELSPLQLNGVLEMQKKLYGKKHKNELINELRKVSREALDMHLRTNTDMSREALLNRLIFGVLIETKERDLYSTTEALFLFSSVTDVPPLKLKQILEHEFSGLVI